MMNNEVKFKYHSSSETIDKGRHGKDYEFEFGKFLLFRLICQRKSFKNFRMTREKTRTGKFDDFAYVYDACDDKIKYCLIQLKHKNENKKIGYEDLTMNSKSYFGLPYYFDYYYESMKFLSRDRDLEGAELEELLFCTNIDLEDNLGCISKTTIPNEGLFENSGNLYKLSIIDPKQRLEIFHEQFLSERKRLANELAQYVMQNKVIELKSLNNDDSFSLIKKFYEMLVEYVLDIKENKFKSSFLDINLKNQNLELEQFRKEFFDSVFDYKKKSDKNKNRNVRKKDILLPTDSNDIEGIIKYLNQITVTVTGIPDITKKLSEELVLSIMLQKSFDISTVVNSRESFDKYTKLIEENVIDINSNTLKATFLNLPPNAHGNDDHDYFKKCFSQSLNKFLNKDINEFNKICNVYNCNPDLDIIELMLKDFEKRRIEIDSFLNKKHILYTKFSCNTESSTEMFPPGFVDIKTTDDNILKFLNLLTFAVNQDNFEALVFTEMQKLVTKLEDKSLIYKEFHNYMNNWHNDYVSSLVLFDSTLKFREWITEENLLEGIKTLNIVFQNKEIKFSNICSCYEVFTPEMLIYYFAKNVAITFGKGIEKEFTSFNIRRNLTQNKKINSNIFKEKSEDIIIITISVRNNPVDVENQFKIKLQDLESFEPEGQYLYTRENYEYTLLMNFYSTNRERISNRTVHWISFLGSDLRYESSLTDSLGRQEQQILDTEISINYDIIKKCQSNKHFVDSELVLDENESFVIITGNPGSGKSILLHWLSYQLKNLNLFLINWVIFISLNEHQKYFDKLDHFDNLDKIIDFLARIENSENDFSRSILRYLLQNGRVILLFDGFDELHESSRQEKVIELLQFLKAKTLTKRIYITSRPHCVKLIEEALEVVSFEVKDISENEQIELVTEEWKSYYGDSSIRLIEENAAELVENINDDTRSNHRDFLGVPLTTYLFAIAYRGEALKSTFYELDINLVQLYDDFISSKYDIFFNDKVRTEKVLQKDFKNFYEKRFRMFALKYSGIIPSIWVDILSKCFNIELNDEIIEILNRIGLIYETNVGGQFIHETFAEYYVADFLLALIENYPDKIEMIKNVLMKPENQFILQVFDNHLISKSEIFKIQYSIMKGEEDFICNLNKESFTEDIIGRNCFYYALIENQFDIVSYLIKRDVDLVFEPFFLNCLKYFVEDFLEDGEQEETYIELFEYILEKENENGKFAQVLDQYLSLGNEICYQHWKIAARLITKFGREVEFPSARLYAILNAPKEFFYTYIKLLDKETDTDWVGIVKFLLNYDTYSLDETIKECSEFILKIPVCRNLLDQTCWKHGSYINFSSYVNSLKLGAKHFDRLLKFIFESKDMSFKDINKYLQFPHKHFFFTLSTISNGKLEICLPYDIEKLNMRISNLNAVSFPVNEDPLFYYDLLYTLREFMKFLDYDENEIVHVAASKIINHVLSSSDLERLKQVFNKCCYYETIEDASLYWEDAKRTDLSKYYNLPINK